MPDRTETATPEMIHFGYCPACGDYHQLTGDPSACTTPPKTRYHVEIFDRWENARIFGDSNSLRECQQVVNRVLEDLIPRLDVAAGPREGRG